MSEPERPLIGGNATSGVVRIGDTVRKPWTKATPAVIEFMARVRSAGVDVPVAHGRDEQGRQILEFVRGKLAMELPPLSFEELARVGRLIRSIHDASDGFTPTVDARWESVITSPGSDLICHGDLAPWNLIIGERWVFIDWDASGPSTRQWDLAYAAQAFTLNDPTMSPAQAGRRLAAFVAGYGADRPLRLALPTTMVQRVRAMHDLLRSSHRDGVEPWASMYVNGHGAYWAAVLDYVERNEPSWNLALDAPGEIL